MMNKGKVYIVGAGPGDPKLITVYGRECIEKADVIIYDRLVSAQLLTYAKEGTTLLYCGKEPKKHGNIQQQIHEWLVQYALQGKTVVRLKGGDPFMFGRGGEEAEHLRAYGIPYEIVPGVTAGVAAPAYAGIPVTHRNYAGGVTFIAGHQSGERDRIRWDALSEATDTIVFYMGMANIAYICEQLRRHGKDGHTPVAVIEWATTNKQRTVVGTLQTIVDIVNEKQLSSPAIIVVGDVVRLHDQLKWVEETW